MVILICIVILALIFDFINGFHDAPNSIATVVATRVLTPVQAVIWAGFFNFVAYFIAKYLIGEFGIADTVSKIVEVSFVDDASKVIMCGLVAAILWNLLTWWLGIPSSSSHTLIGGIAGSAIVSGGLEAVHFKIVGFIAIFIVLAPMIGFISGNIITILSMHLFKNIKPSRADKYFKRMQLVSSALLSIAHGMNDSQKVMGIIAAALISATALDPSINHWFYMKDMSDMHDWIPLACFSMISLGTLAGGMKILKTMGNKITKLYPFEGFASQLSSSITLFVSEYFHVPVSTTHVVTGSIIGVGSVRRFSAVRWGVTKNLLWAWVLTIPISGALGGILYLLVDLFL